jgi:hypothetical protein
MIQGYAYFSLPRPRIVDMMVCSYVSQFLMTLYLQAKLVTLSSQPGQELSFLGLVLLMTADMIYGFGNLITKAKYSNECRANDDGSGDWKAKLYRSEEGFEKVLAFAFITLEVSFTTAALVGKLRLEFYVLSLDQILLVLAAVYCLRCLDAYFRTQNTS